MRAQKRASLLRSFLLSGKVITVNKNFVHALSLISAIAGAVSFLLYLHFVGPTNPYLPFDLVPIGVLFLSVGIILSYGIISRACNQMKEGSVFPFLFVLYTLTVSLILIRSVRFDVLSGTDNLFEYRAAQDTLTLGFWPIQYLEENKMIASATLTLFSAILARVTGIDMMFIFTYILQMIYAIIPVLLFLLVREVFNDTRVAAIASILYSESFTFFYHNAELNRLQIAVIPLLLSLYLIYRSNKINPIKSRLLLALLMISVVIGHYSLSYFYTVLLLALAVCRNVFLFLPKKLIKNLQVNLSEMHIARRYVTKELILFFTVASFSWFLFFIPWLFSKEVSLAGDAVLSIMGMYPKAYSVVTGYIFESPMGPISTIWNDFIIALSLIGLVYAWFKMKDKDKKIVLWAFGSSAFMLMLLLWYLLPRFSLMASLARLWGICSLLVFPFGAYLLIKMNKKTKELLIITILMINLPMNLILFSHKDVTLITYHPYFSIESKKSSTELYNTLPGLLASVWVKKHIPPTEVISCDYRGSMEMFYASRRLGEGGYFREVDHPDFAFNSRYLVLHYFYLRFGLWVVCSPELKRTAILANMSSRLRMSNAIYDSWYFLLLQRMMGMIKSN